jgi:hypothetical protein
MRSALSHREKVADEGGWVSAVRNFHSGMIVDFLRVSEGLLLLSAKHLTDTSADGSIWGIGQNLFGELKAA